MLAGLKMVLAAGVGPSQVLPNSFPIQTVRYREVQGTCTGDVLNVVSLLLDYASKGIGSPTR